MALQLGVIELATPEKSPFNAWIPLGKVWYGSIRQMAKGVECGGGRGWRKMFTLDREQWVCFDGLWEQHGHDVVLWMGDVTEEMR